MNILEVAYRTDTGKQRSLNEDSVLVAILDDHYILGVADGLGGHNAGEVASRVAVTEAGRWMKKNLKKVELREALRGAVCEANRSIYQLSLQNSSYAGMGSTLILAVVNEDTVWLANVGDSRAYIIGKCISRITRDHSLVQEMLDRGLLSLEEVRSHPQKHVITKSLGRNQEIQPDFYRLELSGGVLLLCSDGLSDSLSDEEMAEIIADDNDLDEASARLVKLANERGGRDNTTVILARQRGRKSFTSR